jgi:hypothetical protein
MRKSVDIPILNNPTLIPSFAFCGQYFENKEFRTCINKIFEVFICSCVSYK